MSAQPYESPSHHGVPLPRDAASVHAALSSDRAAKFRAEWEAALDQARTDLDLNALNGRLDRIVGDYWAVASANLSSSALQADEDGRRWRAGEEVSVIPGDQVL